MSYPTVELNNHFKMPVLGLGYELVISTKNSSALGDLLPKTPTELWRRPSSSDTEPLIRPRATRTKERWAVLWTTASRRESSRERISSSPQSCGIHTDLIPLYTSLGSLSTSQVKWRRHANKAWRTSDLTTLIYSLYHLLLMLLIIRSTIPLFGNTMKNWEARRTKSSNTTLQN